MIIGGLGSFWGTLAGGIVLGLAQTIGARIDPEWQILAGHVAFLVVLVLGRAACFPRAGLRDAMMDAAAAKPTQAFRIETAGRASRAAASDRRRHSARAGAASGRSPAAT